VYDWGYYFLLLFVVWWPLVFVVCVVELQYVLEIVCGVYVLLHCWICVIFVSVCCCCDIVICHIIYIYVRNVYRCCEICACVLGHIFDVCCSGMCE